RNAWFARGLGANSTTLGLAPLAFCFRTMRDDVALGAQRREAAGRSTLLEVVFVVGALRPLAPACPADTPCASNCVVGLGAVAVIEFDACALGGGSTCLSSGPAILVLP